MSRVALATIGVLALGGTAQAQFANGNWTSHGSFASPTASVTSRAQPIGSQSMAAPTPAQQQMAEQRLRIATSMVRNGRCDEALKLAQRQNDQPLEGAVRASCLPATAVERSL